MSDRTKDKPWYEMGLGLKSRARSVYFLFRHLPGRYGVEPYATWIDHARKSRMEKTLAEFDLLVSSLSEGSVVLDCGANIGEITAKLAETGAHVHSFEPEPYLFSRLQSRFRNAKNVTLHNAAVSARSGTVEFWLEEDRGRDPSLLQSHSIVFGGNALSKRSLQVECVDLFDFVAKLRNKPALIKMDIEGAEVEILERLIGEQRFTELGPVFVEMHERQIPAMRARIVEIFRRIGAEPASNVNLFWP